MQVQHCTDLSPQVLFSAHTEQGKTGPWLGQTLSLIRRRRRMRRQAKERQEKREDRWLISKSCLLPFCGRSGGSIVKKIGLRKGSAWGSWDPQEGQQLFRSNPNGVRDRTTMLRWMLVGAEKQSYRSSYLIYWQSKLLI